MEENSFGSFLRKKRKEKNLTQKELSKLLYVTESAVSKWEKDVAHPDILLLPKLVEILDVTEHELITASVDNEAREERAQAKKWRTLLFAWNLFFYIAYGVSLITCFICNLAVDKTLSWFFIVLSAVFLAFTFTSLPTLVKSHRLIILPSSMYLALCLLLGVCCIYTEGDWFVIPTLSVFFGLTIIFAPIYIAKLKVFRKIRKYNDFVSILIDFIALNILLFVINLYTLSETDWWYFTIALPIVFYVYLIINLFLCVRFFKLNRFLKTSIVLSFVDIFVYLPLLFVRSPEANDANILMADFSNWHPDGALENNIHLIIFLSILLTSFAFLTVGLTRCFFRKNK